MNPTVLLTVTIISMLLNAYYMGRVFLLKKILDIHIISYKRMQAIAFKYYSKYMRSKLDSNLPEDHLVKSFRNIVQDLACKDILESVGK